jgi:hypothetical protein
MGRPVAILRQEELMRLNNTDLGRLDALEGQTFTDGVMSLYVPFDVSAPSRDDVAARVMNTVRALRQAAPADQLARIDTEEAAILDFVRGEYVPQGTCLAVFSSSPSQFREVFSFQLPSPAIARFGSAPYLLPIDALKEDFGPTLVVMVSQEEARLIRLNLGEIDDEAGFDSDVPSHQRQGGRAGAHYERDRLQHIDEHLRRVAAGISDEAKAAPFEHLVLSGTNEVTEGLISHLNPATVAQIAGRLHLEMFAPVSAVADAATEAITANERIEEAALVKRLIGTALGGGKAALGRDETLQMLREGRARSLVVASDQAFIGDGEAAFTLASAAGLDIEVVQGEAATLLAPYAGLAAELRY